VEPVRASFEPLNAVSVVSSYPPGSDAKISRMNIGRRMLTVIGAGTFSSQAQSTARRAASDGGSP
jgi:hypothetical protein